MASFPADSVRTKTWGEELLTSADLHTQFDVLHSYIQAALNSTSGHAHTGAANQGPKLSPANLVIASQAAGDILYASSSTAWARLAKGTEGQALVMNTGATAPKWGDVTYTPTAANALAGSVVQVVNYQTGEYASGTTAIPYDDTIPQQTEGTELMTLAITPKSATNKLKIDVVVNHTTSNNETVVALFQDATNNAIACVFQHSIKNCTVFTHYMTAGTTSETTFKVRAGVYDGSAFQFNGGYGARRLGGVNASSITITEIKA